MCKESDNLYRQMGGLRRQNLGPNEQAGDDEDDQVDGVEWFFDYLAYQFWGNADLFFWCFISMFWRFDICDLMFWRSFCT